jgi:carbon storage regulator
MLVLSRKAEEKIHIGENITITIVKVKGKSVQLGIDAPEGMRILRGELADRQANTSQVTHPRPETAASVSTDGPCDDGPPPGATPEGWQDPPLQPSASRAFLLEPTQEARIGRRLVRVRAFVIRA